LYISQTIIYSILVYGAEVWQIATRETNKILSTEMDVPRSARKSRMERMNNEQIKEIMGVKGKPDIIERKRLQWYGHVKRMPEERIPKTNYGTDTMGGKGKRTPKGNVDGRSTSSHDKKCRTRSMEKQRGTVFGFQKTATAVKNTG
jgi:hypothetical protein